MILGSCNKTSNFHDATLASGQRGFRAAKDSQAYRREKTTGNRHTRDVKENKYVRIEYGTGIARERGGILKNNQKREKHSGNRQLLSSAKAGDGGRANERGRACEKGRGRERKSEQEGRERADEEKRSVTNEEEREVDRNVHVGGDGERADWRVSSEQQWGMVVK